MTAQHTPTPWRAGRRIDRYIYSPSGIAVAATCVLPSWYAESASDNAAFIISACNAYESLVSALREIADNAPEAEKRYDSEYVEGFDDGRQEAADIATAALSKAGAA